MSDPQTPPPAPSTPFVLTPEQAQARRRRNVAIALTIVALCILFYAVTIAKLGPGILARPGI